MTGSNANIPAAGQNIPAAFSPPSPLYFAVTNGTKDSAGNLVIIGWCRQGLGNEPAPQEGYTYHPLTSMTEDGWNTPSRWETAKAITSAGEIVERAAG